MRQSYGENRSKDTRIDLPVAPVDYGNHHNRLDKRTSPPNKSWIAAIGLGLAAIFAILAIAAFLYPQQLKHQLAISFVRQPTPYTQLYFTNPEELPGSFNVNQKITFDFTIENDEGGTHTYTYTITLEDSRSRLVVDQQTVIIPDMSSAVLPVTVVPKDQKSRYLISVNLKGMNQSIHFYAESS